MKQFLILVVFVGLALSGCQMFGPKLSGRVSCGGADRTPAAKALVELRKNLQVVGTTTAGSDGRFVLAVPESLEGGYILSARADCGNGSKVLPPAPTKTLEQQNLTLFK